MRIISKQILGLCGLVIFSGSISEYQLPKPCFYSHVKIYFPENEPPPKKKMGNFCEFCKIL